MKKRRDRFPYPLPYPMAVRDGNGKYPERVKVLFSDGHARMYAEEVKQPEPNLCGERDFRRMVRENGGYKAKEEPQANRWKTVNRLKKVLIAREEELDRMRDGMKRVFWICCNDCPRQQFSVKLDCAGCAIRDEKERFENEFG